MHPFIYPFFQAQHGKGILRFCFFSIGGCGFQCILHFAFCIVSVCGVCVVGNPQLIICKQVNWIGVGRKVRVIYKDYFY